MTTLNIAQGTTYTFPVTATDETTGQPIDLTGKTLYCTVKVNPSDADPGLVQLSVGSGITLRAQAGATLGMCDVKFSATQTEAFPAPQMLVWDLQYDDGGGGVYQLASGIVATTARVTAHS